MGKYIDRTVRRLRLSLFILLLGKLLLKMIFVAGWVLVEVEREGGIR
jgi:hypothetical protein